METSTQNKQHKLFCNLEVGDVIYHMVYKFFKNKEWVLEGYNKITISSFNTGSMTNFSGLKQNMLYDNIPVIHDTYGIDNYDYEKHICSWISFSGKLCIFSTSSLEDSKDEISQILKNNS